MLILPNQLDHLRSSSPSIFGSIWPSTIFFINIWHVLHSLLSLPLKFQIDSFFISLFLASSPPDFTHWGTRGSIFGPPLCLHSPLNTQFEFGLEYLEGFIKLTSLDSTPKISASVSLGRSLKIWISNKSPGAITTTVHPWTTLWKPLSHRLSPIPLGLRCHIHSLIAPRDMPQPPSPLNCGLEGSKCLLTSPVDSRQAPQIQHGLIWPNDSNTSTSLPSSNEEAALIPLVVLSLIFHLSQIHKSCCLHLQNASWTWTLLTTSCTVQSKWSSSLDPSISPPHCRSLQVQHDSRAFILHRAASHISKMLNLTSAAPSKSS